MDSKYFALNVPDHFVSTLGYYVKCYQASTTEKKPSATIGDGNV